MRKIKISSISFLILFCTLLPFSHFSFLHTPKVHADFHEIAQNETWSGSKEINGVVAVNPGATLTIAKGADIKFKGSQSGIIVGGNLIVKGTVVNPVKFSLIGEITANNYYTIEIYNNGKAEFRNTEITKGGYYDDYVPVLCFLDKVKNFFLGKKTYAESLIPVITVYEGGKLEMQACSLHNNAIAIGIYPLDPHMGASTSYNSNDIKVNRSKFIDNQYEDVLSKNNLNYDFQYNWWGSVNGPDENKLEGRINTNNFAKIKDFHDPVIIVPGILGSWKWTTNGDWQMDPIFKTYDSLYKTFKDNGYKEGKDLFTFPYQWRDSNVNTAKLLQKKIQEVKQVANWPKVDIVAHSMGGLVAREYIESADYQDDVDQLVLLGAPNQGSPEDYLVWEGGEISYDRIDLVSVILRELFSQEAKEAGFKNIFEYLHKKPITSVQELLSDYDYLYDATSNKLRSYENGDHYPKNSFLDDLNLPDNLQKLNKVSVINIVGKLDKDQTIKEIKVGKPSINENSQWADGKPEENGLINGVGDGTVPLSSAESIQADEQAEVNFPHMQLPGKTQNSVFKYLTGYSPQKKIPFAGIDKTVFFFAMSPIDIQIISPDGKWIGKNIKNLSESNKIVGAYYTGSDTVNEFATIPNPQEGEYKVITQGTGAGDYKVAIANISEDLNNSGQATEVTAEITGTTEEGKIETNQAEITKNKITVKAQDTIPPTLEITSPENKTYPNNQKLKITYTTADNLTSVDKIKTVVTYDDKILTKKEIDLSLEHLGKHNLKITAQDEAKNQTEKEVNFKVTTNLKAIRQNIYHYRKLKLIKNPRVASILERRITHIQRMDKLLQRLEKNWFPQWWKKRIKRYFQLQKNRQIKSLIRIITKNCYLRSNITKSVRVILVEDLKSLFGHRISK